MKLEMLKECHSSSRKTPKKRNPKPEAHGQIPEHSLDEREMQQAGDPEVLVFCGTLRGQAGVDGVVASECALLVPAPGSPNTLSEESRNRKGMAKPILAPLASLSLRRFASSHRPGSQWTRCLTAIVHSRPQRTGQVVEDYLVRWLMGDDEEGLTLNPKPEKHSFLP